MFGRKIFFLAAGYVAGNIINSLYSSKKDKALEAQKKADITLMVDNFMDTQKNLVSHLEDKYIPEEKQASFHAKKSKLLDFAKTYGQKGKELLQELMEDERVQDKKDSVEQGLLKAKLKGEDALKRGKLMAEKLKK